MGLWYKSDEWRTVIQILDDWSEDTIKFVHDDCRHPPDKDFCSWTFKLIFACDELAPHIDPTPFWELWNAIDVFHAKKYDNIRPPHREDLPSLVEMNVLLERVTIPQSLYQCQ